MQMIDVTQEKTNFFLNFSNSLLSLFPLMEVDQLVEEAPKEPYPTTVGADPTSQTISSPPTKKRKVCLSCLPDPC